MTLMTLTLMTGFRESEMTVTGNDLDEPPRPERAEAPSPG